jgi:RNA polymerase sigma factor (sigma-70 family)
MSIDDLETILDGCKNGSRLSQKRLYQQFFGYGMSVSMRYANTREEAQEICQDGFVKVFAKVNDCTSIGTFKGWFRRIIVNTAIDNYRKSRSSQSFLNDLDTEVGLVSSDTSGLDNISLEEKLSMVSLLPPACKVTFNLYAIEGFSTAEIAESLEVAEGTVRANLAKARFRLQKMIEKSDKIKYSV